MKHNCNMNRLYIQRERKIIIIIIIANIFVLTNGCFLQSITSKNVLKEAKKKTEECFLCQIAYLFIHEKSWISVEIY